MDKILKSLEINKKQICTILNSFLKVVFPILNEQKKIVESLNKNPNESNCYSKIDNFKANKSKINESIFKFESEYNKAKDDFKKLKLENEETFKKNENQFIHFNKKPINIDEYFKILQFFDLIDKIKQLALISVNNSDTKKLDFVSNLISTVSRE